MSQQQQKQKKGLRILVIGGNGVIGKGVVNELKKFANDDRPIEIVIAGRNSGTIKVDITDSKSIDDMFTNNAKFDHVINTCGDGLFGPVSTYTKQSITNGFLGKAISQMDLVLHAFKHLKDGGSITLTSGFLDTYFTYGASGAATINCAVNTFARAAALECPRGIRLNAVSPGLLTESIKTYGPYLPGYHAVDSKDCAYAYVRCVFGGINGKAIEIIGSPHFQEK